MKARCMITLPPGDQKEFVSAVPLLDTVSKSMQKIVPGMHVFATYEPRTANTHNLLGNRQTQGKS